MPVTDSMTLFTMLRRAVLFIKSSGPSGLLRSLPGGGHDQQLGGAIENHGESEQHQSKFHQRAEINIAGGLGKIIGDECCDGVARRKQRSVNASVVTNNHGHS